MASNSVIPSFPIFNDVDGNPLESGYIYCGDPGFNPEVAPKNIFWDAALTVPAAQPIRTIGGFPSRSGAPAMFYTDGDYSLTVRNKNSSLIYSSLNSTFEINIDKYGDTISIVSRAVYMENTSGVADSLILARPDTTINEVAAYYDGLTILFDTAFTNTGATVANIDGLAVKKVRTASDADLSAGAILAGVSYFMVYNTALDSGAGAFELKDMQPQDTYAKLWDPQSVTHNFTSDADYTLTSEQNLYGRIVLTDTSAFLTTSRNIVTDNIQKTFIIQNNTLQILTVKTLAGTGVDVNPGVSRTLYNDGTNIIDGVGEVTGSNIITAWVTFNGTLGTILESYNVSGLTKNATGNFSIIPTVPLDTINFGVAGSCNLVTGSSGCIVVRSDTASTVNSINVKTGIPGTAGSTVLSLQDRDYTTVYIYGGMN